MQNKISIPDHYNYVGIFFTLACNLTCSYCINHLSGEANKKRFLNGDEWIKSLNRLELREDLPLSIQGGEPTLHPHFYKIVNNINSDFKIDLLTNIQFDVFEFMKQIPPTRFDRNAKYASIRVTYHPETMNWENTLSKVKVLQDHGYSVGIFGIKHPRDILILKNAYDEAIANGIDFRYKEFLGIHDGQIYGEYKFKNAAFSDTTVHCLCRTSELLVSPDGSVYRCHHDLYNKYNEVGSILSSDFKIIDEYRECAKFGKCNPCDVKIKNNRFQEWGHTSVDIKFT